MGSSETGDLRGLVDVLTERHTQLEATIDELRTDFSDLNDKYDDLVASTAAQSHERAQWQRETTEKLQSLAGRRRLTSAASTQRRGLSADTCGDPGGPTLLVEGVCSCTGGLLVEGRNVTKELNSMLRRPIPFADCNAKNFLTTVSSVSSHHTARAWAIAIPPNNSSVVFVASPDANGIAVVNVTDIRTPIVMGAVEDSTKMNSPWSIAVSLDTQYVYVTGYFSNSFAVVDVSDLEKPVLVGSIVSNLYFYTPFGLAVSHDGNFVYVTAVNSDRFTVVSVSQPTNPHVVGSASVDQPWAIALSPSGPYVFVSGYSSQSVTIVDVGDPTAPFTVGTVFGNYGEMDLPWGMTIAPNGRYIYVGGRHSDSVTVLNVTNHTEVAVVGNITTPALQSPVALVASHDGKHVFVTSDSGTVAVVGVNDPSQPMLIGTFDTNFDNIRGVAVSPNGEYVYIAASGNDSFVVMEVCQ